MYISFLLITTLIPWSLSAPSPTDRQLALKRDIANPPGMDSADETKKCIYEGGRRTVPGKITRPSVSEVSSSCSGDLIELSQLATPNEFLGTKNELQLIRVRGSASFATDFTNPEVISEYSGQYICNGHRNELSTNWDWIRFAHFVRSNKILKCSYPDEYHGTKRPTVMRLNAQTCSVTLEEASAVMTLERLLLPVGLPICGYHKQQLKDAVETVADSSPSALILRSGAEYSRDSEPQASDSSISPKTKRAFRAFANSAGESRLTGALPSTLDKKTEQRKVCASRRLLDVMWGIVAGEESKEFAEKVIAPAASVMMTKRTTHRYTDVMAVVSQQFYKVTGRRDKLVSLAVIAKAIPIHEIRRFIPGLSERMYYMARRIDLAKIKLEQEKFTRVRFDPAKLKYYTDFITSPLISTDIAFGEKTVVASDGTKYTIPNSIRIQRASEVVHMFISTMKKNNLEHMCFSKSTLYKILRYCVATQRKATVCADYYFSDSEMAFDELILLVSFLFENRAVSNQWKTQKEEEVKETRFYYRGDYRMHSKNHSRVADHCFTHSLSDSNDPKLRRSCENQIPGESHKHDLKCDRCELGKSMLRELWEALDEFESEVDKKDETAEKKKMKEDIDDWRAKLQQAEERIEAYKMHQLRSSMSRKVHEWMVEQADDETASVIMDFSQKVLAQKFLESQSDYFGKKGMSSHVTHVQTKRDGRIAQHQIIHIIENDQQDSLAVIQLMRHVFEELMSAGITTVFLRAYHSSSTIMAAFMLGKETGMKVRHYGFSESQDGKSGADRVSSTFKNKVRAFVNAGGDADNHQNFFKAATSGRLLEATSVYLVRTTTGKAPNVKMDKISGFFDFQYEENGIRAFRHKDIGEGVFFPATSFQKSLSSLPSLTVSASAGHLPDGEGYWRISPIVPDAKSCPKDDIKTLLEVTEKKEFYCPDISCSASFDSAEELEVHWLAGVHCPSPMTATLRDESLKMFSAGLEMTISHRLNIPDVDDAIAELAQSDSDAEENVEQGWALKKRKTVVRFTEKAKAFIENIFDEGIERKQKVPPEEAERRMANARENGERVFEIEERLNARQISSLYSRIAAFREQAGASKNLRSKRFVDMEIDIEEVFDETTMFDEPWYMNDQDLMAANVWEHRHEFFDFGKEVVVDQDEIFKPNKVHRLGRHKRHHTHLMHYLM